MSNKLDRHSGLERKASASIVELLHRQGAAEIDFTPPRLGEHPQKIDELKKKKIIKSHPKG